MDSFEGKTFTVQNGYLKRGNRTLHRLIWQKAYGPIPKGHHIHHKDHDKLNNSLDNLECLSHSEHLRLHMKLSTARNQWHKTDEGRKFLGEKSKKLWENRPFHTLQCLHCGTDFKTKQIHGTKYCDNKCEQAARRLRGDDLIERNCVICSMPFKINKYYKTQTCGYKCGGKLKSKNYQSRS